MAKEKNERINQVAHKLQLLNEDIKNEMRLNPNIMDKENFVDHLDSVVKKFIIEHYRN